MKIYGLAGKSGTGKSYHAAELCGRLGIDAIIDDGLLICSNSIAAGVSAKKELTKMGATKAAIFEDPVRRKSMTEAVKALAPENILIIGTSCRMIELVAERLELPRPEKIISIEAITTAEERETASYMRNEKGMHEIPAPTLQVKKSFSGYLLDPKKAFMTQSAKGEKEATVVRPTYSYLGSFEISDKVISDAVFYAAGRIPAVSEVLFVSSKAEEEGIYIRIIAMFRRGFGLRDAAETLQKDVAGLVEKMTSFNVMGVSVQIRGIKP